MTRKNLYKRIADLEAENEMLKNRLKNSNSVYGIDEPFSKLEKIRYIKEKANCDLWTAVNAQNMFSNNVSDAVQYAIKITKIKK